MKKLLLTCTLATIAFCQMYAGVITSSTAQTVALNYFKGISGNTASNLSATLIYTKAESNQTADFYIFNMSPVHGFVIVSANDNAQPVIAYSTESNFSTNFSKIGLSNWMNTAAAKINNIVTNNIVADASITNLWTAYEQGISIASSRSSAVAPLLTTTWNQYSGNDNTSTAYDIFCPYNSTDQQYCVTGCVATAMAQIMKFWNYPAHGTGSYSYDDAPPDFSYSYGVQSANFGATTYNWAAMPTAVTGSSNDTSISTLMYQCGVAVAMDYGDLNEGGSGAVVIGSAPSAQAAYSTYFAYNASTIQGVQQSSYTAAAWVTLLENELNAGRPIQYEGFDPSVGGHTWVCDGYDASGDFHMNWGWGGEDNGYFSLTSLSVAGYTFNTDDGALIGIEPAVTVSCGIPANLSSASITSSSATVSWGAVSGASSYNLQYQASGTSTWTTVSLTGTSYAISGLAAGTTYNYEVQTVCPGGLSSVSTPASFTTLTGCGAPGTLAATTITTTSATLSWGAVTGATSYNLQYQASGASTWTTVSLTTGTSYNLTGLTTGITYNYRVETVCSSGSSTYSAASSFTTLTNCGIVAGLTASAITTTTATISWDAVTGATSYTLEYQLAGTTGWNTFSLSGTVVDFSGLTAGTTYNYAVQTVCSSGTSAYTAVASFTTLSTATCGVPTGLASSSVTTTSATVSWGAVTGATSYNLEYKTSAATTWTTVLLTGTSYSLTGLTTGTTYDYQVQTVCSSGSSAYSTASSFTTLTSCGVPSGLASSSVTTTSATISWGAVTGSSSYNLEYKTSSATIWTTVSLTGTSYGLTGLTAGTTYDYQVQTVCSSGSSAYSAASSFTTLTSCGVPSGLASSSVTTTNATVSWGAVTGASSYNLEYKTSSSTTWTTVSLTGTSSSLTGLTAGTTYDYQVQTVCSSGSSAYSTASSFTTLTSCGVPSGLASSSVTTTNATVSWGAVTGASSYNLEYKTSSSTTWTTVSLTGTSSSLTGLTTGTTYDYQVQTVCSSGSSAYSTASSFTTLTSCGVPSGLASSSVTTGSATVSWSAVTGATSYNLEYQASGASTWTTVSLTGISSNLTGLAAGTTYDYQVQTICASGSSAYSTAGSFTTATSTSCAVPAGLASSLVTTNSATVSWDEVAGAISYNFQYKLSTWTEWSTISMTGTEINFSDLTAGTTYDYEVQTICSSGSSAYSTPGSFTTLTTGCGVPSELASSSLTTTTATVSWGAITGATSYNLEYKTSAATSWTTVSLTGTSSNLTGLTAGTTYDFQVQTVCSSGSSAYSTASSFITLTSCGVATGLSSSSVTTTTAFVSWGAVTGASSYTLEYQAPGASTWTTVSLAGTSYNLTGLTEGTTYNYQVQTVCASGSSAYSPASSFTTTTPPSCGVPAGLASGSVTTTTATVSWGAVTGASSYNLEYQASGASTWTTVSLAGTTYNFTGLTEGTVYNYQVQTVCSSGSSAYSAASSFTTTSPGSCGVPTGLESSLVTSSTGTVSWNAVAGATSYNFEYKLSTWSAWSTLSMTGTEINFSDLKAGTTIDYQVQSVCSSGTSAYSESSSFTTSSSISIAAVTDTSITYCDIQGTSTAFEHIKSVTFGSFTGTSENNNGYEDHSATNIPMAAGSTVAFTLTPGFTVGSFDEYWAIYIDYNNNGLFTDPGELVFASTGSNTATTGSFSIPEGLSGTARMRIIMQYNSPSSSPCGTFAWGNAEDYTVNFSATGLSTFSAGLSSPTEDVNVAPAPWIYPNPASNLVHVMLVPVQIQTKIEILSITGQIVTSYIATTGDREADLDVSALAPGVYIIRTTYGEDRASVEKLIKI